MAIATTNHGRPPASRDLWLAQRDSQILIDGPVGQQKCEDLGIKLQLSGFVNMNKYISNFLYETSLHFITLVP